MSYMIELFVPHYLVIFPSFSRSIATFLIERSDSKNTRLSTNDKQVISDNFFLITENTPLI